MADRTEHDLDGPEENWLSVLTGAPYFGDWVCLGLALLPLFVVIAVTYPIAPGLVSESDDVTRREGLVFLVVCVATIAWLNLLRQRFGVVLRFFFVPCIWIAWVFGVSSVWVMIFGG